MTRLRLIAALALVFVVAAGSPAKPMSSADVTVVVENLRNANGDVRVALWSTADGFTEADSVVAETKEKAQFGSVILRLAGLPTGRYAVVSYHDENGNGDFDRTFLGLPKEGLGFSNGAWISLGPPAFDEAAVDVEAPNEVIVVKLRY